MDHVLTLYTAWGRRPRRRAWPGKSLRIYTAVLTMLVASLGVSPAAAQHGSGDLETTSTAETAAPAGAGPTGSVASHAAEGETMGSGHDGARRIPHLLWTVPFVAILLAIAIFPLVPSIAHWWEHNRNRLLISVILAAITCAYYLLRGWGFHHAEAGWPTLMSVLDHAVVKDYIPFIVLLFSLYVISGGIRLSGDIPAHPITNTLFLAAGTLLASLIATTGAAMLLIRPLLQVNSERKHVVHTVVFFIFLVANIGGSLLPIGDPPLFLGYLRGVPFLWTFNLFPPWLPLVVVLLVMYFVIDLFVYGKEEKKDIDRDETVRKPLKLEGNSNFLLLVGVILAVAFLVPGKKLPGLGVEVPNLFLREIAQLTLAGLSMWLTPKALRKANHFDFHAINEVAALFIGIFITMQVPVEILHVKGPTLGLDKSWQFFWATGALSAFLDNAPTYVVFFETAGTLKAGGMPVLEGLRTTTGFVPVPLLLAISCGAVFMGAMTYIGNGPNFLVKSIAESRGVKMPSFFGYMVWSIAILVPLYLILTFIFFV